MLNKKWMSSVGHICHFQGHRILRAMTGKPVWLQNPMSGFD